MRRSRKLPSDRTKRYDAKWRLELAALTASDAAIDWKWRVSGPRRVFRYDGITTIRAEH